MFRFLQCFCIFFTDFYLCLLFVYKSFTDLHVWWISIDFIDDSLAVSKNFKNDEKIVLFVKLSVGQFLNAKLKKNIIYKLRTECSPKHIPSYIIQIDDIPYTINGKKIEIAVKNIINGLYPKNISSIANPKSLKLYENLKDFV